MKDSELDEILRSGRLPDPGTEYWERFPKRVMARIASSTRVGGKASVQGASGWISAVRSLVSLPRMTLAAAVAVVVLGVFVWLGKDGGSAVNLQAQLAQAQKYFNELEPLFPNQLRAIVFDPQGPRVVLAEKADVPSSPPIYIRICGPKGCQGFVTFSGQQLRVDGDTFDVLVDCQGEVLLVGGQGVWSSSSLAAGVGRYRIAARLLPTAS
jgi:hypothetical protein